MKTIEQRIIETQDQIIEKVKDWAQAFCKSDTEGLQETEYIISKLESELSDLKALAELQKETIVPYIKSEYDIQREKMKKLFGKYPDVFEQGVNALICAVEDFKALAEQPSFQWDDDKVIDFISWYLKLCKLSDRFEIENQTILDSFKRGDKPEMWHTEHPEQVSAEEILKKHCIENKVFLTSNESHTIIEAMHECASLSSRFPSEEEIMEAANEIFPELGGIKNENIAAFEIGVNWLKSYIKG